MSWCRSVLGPNCLDTSAPSVFWTLRHWCRSVLVPKCLGSEVSGYPTRGYANSRIANSRTGRLADWTSHRLVNSRTRLDNSRTGQVADWTSRRCHRQLCVLSFRSFGDICETASCPVRELTSPRDVQSASWQSASWRIRELSSYHLA